jgi:hypothetical protein
MPYPLQKPPSSNRGERRAWSTTTKSTAVSDEPARHPEVHRGEGRAPNASRARTVRAKPSRKAATSQAIARSTTGLRYRKMWMPSSWHQTFGVN